MSRVTINARATAAAIAAVNAAAVALGSGQVRGWFRLALVTNNGTIGPPAETYHGRGWATWMPGAPLEIEADHVRREVLQIVRNWLYLMDGPGEHWRAVLRLEGRGCRLEYAAHRITRQRTVAQTTTTV